MKLLEYILLYVAINCYKFFDKKARSGISINEQLAKECINQKVKNSKGKKFTRDLKTILGQQI